jgi:hypothetical protein
MMSPMSPRIRLRMQRVMSVVGCDELVVDVLGGAMATAVGAGVAVIVTDITDENALLEDVNALLDDETLRWVELLVGIVVMLVDWLNVDVAMLAAVVVGAIVRGVEELVGIMSGVGVFHGAGVVVLVVWAFGLGTSRNGSPWSLWRCGASGRALGAIAIAEEVARRDRMWSNCNFVSCIWGIEMLSVRKWNI